MLVKGDANGSLCAFMDYINALPNDEVQVQVCLHPPIIIIKQQQQITIARSTITTSATNNNINNININNKMSK